MKTSEMKRKALLYSGKALPSKSEARCGFGKAFSKKGKTFSIFGKAFSKKGKYFSLPNQLQYARTRLLFSKTKGPAHVRPSEANIISGFWLRLSNV